MFCTAYEKRSYFSEYDKGSFNCEKIYKRFGALTKKVQ